MSAEEARRLIESMKVKSNVVCAKGYYILFLCTQDNGFYHEDIFGVTLKTAEVTTRVRTAAKRWVWLTILIDALSLNMVWCVYLYVCV